MFWPEGSTWTLDKIQTKDNLLKHNIIDQGVSQGGVVDCVLETLLEIGSHLLFSCKMTYNVWLMCYNWVGFKQFFLRNRAFI